VTRDILRAARLMLLPTIAFILVVGFLPGRTGIAVRIYALGVCGVVLLLALVALLRAYPVASRLRPAGRRAEPPRRPPQSLMRLEQEAAIGVAGAFDFHFRLRPRLRDLARELLDTRVRISLDGHPDEARAVLGDETWELVREDRPPPEDRLARGLPPAALGRVVDTLERV
jgi:hypothetical protein